MKAIGPVLLSLALLTSSSAYAQSMLRVACAAGDIGAEVSVNGKFKGECPIDIQVVPGSIKLRVEKKGDALREYLFEQEFRIGDGVVKKVDVILAARFTAVGLKQEEERAAAEAARAEADLWRQAESGQSVQALTAYIQKYPNSSLIAVAQEKLLVARKAEEERPGRVFRDCAECPEMVVIPAGSFAMGSDKHESEERPVHQVTIARSYAIGKTELTQRQWNAVMDRNPSKFSDCAECPIEMVTWNDAQDFVKRLSEKTGKTYRLPSEAEWEYACRAGGRHLYCGSDDVGAVAWYSKNINFDTIGAFESTGNVRTRPVAGKQANAWGLHDMSGNVFEWTQDCWNDNYSGAPGDGSAWITGECNSRVTRGGARYNRDVYVRATFRLKFESSYRDYPTVGFRPVRNIP